MKIPVRCPECGTKIEVEVVDDNYYKIECVCEKKCGLYAQMQKFQILFDMGVVAVNEGYNREAVSNFASSLERYLEFYIKVLLKYNNVNKEEFDKGWKEVKNQSERQLGAFFLLYLSYFKRPVEYINKNQIKFRNEVIHKGKIPNQQETISYGENIYNFIKESLTEMKIHFSEQIQNVISDDIEKIRSEKLVTQEEINFAIGGHENILSLYHWKEDEDNKTFTEIL